MLNLTSYKLIRICINDFGNMVFRCQYTPMLRHPTSNKLILNAPACIDDFGNMVFRCQYTSKFVATNTAIFMGPIMPNVSGTYVCSPDCVEEYKLSKSNFNAIDTNCNFCVNLERVKHAKNAAGFLYGSCKKDVTMHQYPVDGKVIMFHPEDPMHMKCWEPR